MVFSHWSYEMIRATGGADQHNVSLMAMSALVTIGVVIPMSAFGMLTITWMSFTSKKLLERPTITGNTRLFLGLNIPFYLLSLVCCLVSCISHAVYLIVWRVMYGGWLIYGGIVGILAFRYGYLNYHQLKTTGNKFGLMQQLVSYVMLAFVCFTIFVVLLLHTIFLQKVDETPVRYLLTYGTYRVLLFALHVCVALYTFIGTSRWRDRSLRKGDSSTRMRTFSVSSKTAEAPPV